MNEYNHNNQITPGITTAGPKEYNLEGLVANSLQLTSRAPYFFTKEPAQTAKASDYSALKAHVAKQGKASLLGTPIFMPCSLEFEDKDDTLKVDLYGEPLIEFTMSKTMVETPIDGKKGSYKELYSLNDYIITIQGVIMNDDRNEYPEQLVRKLRTILEKPKHLRINNELARIFGVSYIAVKEARFPAVKGAQNWTPYEISAVSDQLFDIKLKQKRR